MLQFQCVMPGLSMYARTCPLTTGCTDTVYRVAPLNLIFKRMRAYARVYVMVAHQCMLVVCAHMHVCCC